MEYIQQKTFPIHYDDELIALLRAMSMTDLKSIQIVGSASLRSIEYSGDYDVFEKVKAKSFEELTRNLQSVVKRIRSVPNTTIIEIKCGEIPEWNVFSTTARIEDGQIKDFNPQQSKAKIDELRSQLIISKQEAKEANQLLSKATTIDGFLDAKKKIRFHILRWTIKDILNGELQYRRHLISLQQALESGGLTKIDTITLIKNRFTEVSILYEMYVNGKRISGPPTNLVQSLDEDILYYNKRNAFKALKRLFSKSRATENIQEIERIVPILNSDLGLLNRLNGDIDTLVEILKQPHPPARRIVNSLRDFQIRLGSMYQYNELLQQEPSYVGTLEAILRTTNKRHRIQKLEQFSKLLTETIHKATLKLLKNQLK